MKSFVPNNKRYKILTDTGFSDFIGVTKSEGDFEMVENVLDSGESIKCTTDHKIFTDNATSVEAGSILPNTKLYKSQHTLIEQKGYKTRNVFDILHVEHNHRFALVGRGGVIAHVENCVYL